MADRDEETALMRRLYNARQNGRGMNLSPDDVQQLCADDSISRDAGAVAWRVNYWWGENDEYRQHRLFDTEDEARSFAWSLLAIPSTVRPLIYGDTAQGESK